MAGPRRRAREIALQVLVQMDVGGDLDAAQGLRVYFDHLADESDLDGAEGEAASALGVGGGAGLGATRAPPAFDRRLVEDLVAGVEAHRAEIDQVVQELSRNWRLERMALVERNIIRLALYELKFAGTVPVNVVINEAIELAKRYGTAEGAAFVNGLLDRAAGGRGTVE
jgi:N utilization substance protein B